MKKLLLLFAITFAASSIFAQYQGEPWYGTPWTFGTDSIENINVGETVQAKNDDEFFNGVAHSAYDIGVVDTLIRPSEDPTGEKVAGSGVQNGGGVKNDFRMRQAAADGITLDQSDIDAFNSPNYGEIFSTHQNRAVTAKTGGWYRYTCSFSEAGNYQMVLRMWEHNDPGYTAWVRVYNKSDMAPLYPWTMIHPGENGEGVIGLRKIDITQPFWDTSLHVVKTNGAYNWFDLDGVFTLTGDVVVEFSDVGPTEAHGESIRPPGSGNFGEFSFMYVGPEADEFAPVADVIQMSYDDMETISLTISENGTLYLVPDGTAPEDAESAKIDKMEMTTSDTYEKDVSELDLEQDIQIITMDAAGNSRISPTISLEAAFTVDTTAGNNGDMFYFNTTRAGTVYLVPTNVNGDLTNLSIALASANADTALTTGGLDSLTITTLTGDVDCNLWFVDGTTSEVSEPIAFQLGEGGDPASVAFNELSRVTVAAVNNEILVRHNADYNTIRIFDILGKQHIREHVNTQEIHLDASDLTSGVYILRMSGNDGIVSKKFLLSK